MRDAFMLTSLLLFLVLLYYLLKATIISHRLRSYDLRRLLIIPVFAPHGESINHFLKGEIELRPKLKNLKKIVYLLFALVIIMSVAGYSTVKANTKASAKSESAEAFAEKYLMATNLQQWDQLYTYLHPDTQTKYTKERFIADRKQYGSQFATSIKDYKVETAVKISTWIDTKGTGTEYKNVVEVPIAYNFKDGASVTISVHLAKAPDGTWRWFWSPADAQLIEHGQLGKLGQFEFKGLTIESTKDATMPAKTVSDTTSTFVTVKLGVTNKRKSLAQLRDFEFKLADLNKKVVYGLNSDVSSSLNLDAQKPAVYLYSNLSPNLESELTLIFEVPAEANYALGITYKNDGVMLKLK